MWKCIQLVLETNVESNGASHKLCSLWARPSISLNLFSLYNALSFVHKIVVRATWDKIYKSSSRTSQCKHHQGGGILCSFTTFSSTLEWAFAMCLLCEPGLWSQETGEHVMLVLPTVFSLASGSSAIEHDWGQVMSRGLMFHPEL